MEHIKLALQRGRWRYSISDPTYTPPLVQLENGLQFNLAEHAQQMEEKNQFLAERSKMMQVLKEPEPVAKKAPAKPKTAAKTPAKGAAAGKAAPAKDAKKK